MGILFWGVINLIHTLKHPPPFRFWSLLWYLSYKPFRAITLSSIPVFTVLFLIKAQYEYLRNADDVDVESNPSMFNFEGYAGDWQEGSTSGSMSSDRRQPVQYGRTGWALFVMASYLIWLGASLFVPDSTNIQAGDDIRQEADGPEDAYADDEDEQ